MVAGGKYDALDDSAEWLGVAESSGNPIREKSYSFALTIAGLYKRLREHREFVVSKQLLRAGTSIGANVEEATAAESRRDFIHKMTIASKEARETLYWLRLLDDSELVRGLNVTAELEQAREIVRLLTSIVKSLSANPKAK
jgi:four helix bundle protein